MAPLIGIPTGLDAAGRWRPGRTYQYLDIAYAQAVAEAGATPVHLSSPADPSQLVRHLDGLLVPGGDDLLPPVPYPGVVFDAVDAEQLRFDRALLDAAAARELPVLGICYGMQLMALRAGGRLHYDIGSDLPAAASHQLEDDARHRVALSTGSRLAALLGSHSVEVNSRHHQAVEVAGERLRIVGRADDGVAEALEAPDRPFHIGVQWHPEGLGTDHRRALFGAFVSACASR